MSLLDELQAPRFYKLRVDEVLSELPKKDAADLLAAVQDRSIAAGHIEAIMHRHGVSLSRSAVESWRRRNP